MRTNQSFASRRAFSLVELLTVIAIIAALSGFAIVASNSMFKGNQLTVAGQDLQDTLALARQTALASNRVVEVRFYKYTDPEVPAATETFRAWQLFQYDEANAVAKPVGKVRALPVTILMETSPTYSTLLAGTQKTNWSPQDAQINIPRVNKNYKAYVVRFRADGSTDLGSNGNWFITLRSVTDTATPPNNFYTVQINPTNGAVKSYRPG